MDILTAAHHPTFVDYFTCLPDELIVHILSFLPKRALCRTTSTCHRLAVIGQDTSFWQTLDVRAWTPERFFRMLEMPRYGALRTLLLRGKVDDVSLSRILDRCASTLLNLSLYGHAGKEPSEDAVEDCLSRVPQLRHLEMTSTATDRSLQAVVLNCTHLWSLTLNGSRFTETVLAQVGDLPALTRVDCLYESGLQDGQVAALVSRCHTLRCLDLAYCRGLTGRVADIISDNCPNIEVL